MSSCELDDRPQMDVRRKSNPDDNVWTLLHTDGHRQLVIDQDMYLRSNIPVMAEDPLLATPAAPTRHFVPMSVSVGAHRGELAQAVLLGEPLCRSTVGSTDDDVGFRALMLEPHAIGRRVCPENVSNFPRVWEMKEGGGKGSPTTRDHSFIAQLVTKGRDHFRHYGRLVVAFLPIGLACKGWGGNDGQGGEDGGELHVWVGLLAGLDTAN